jgi:hypothetical protein
MPALPTDLPLFAEPECPCGFAHATLKRLMLRERRTLAECQASNHPAAEDMAAGVDARCAKLQWHLDGGCA